MGGSNGGLLVGAAMVQRPELFRAVSCGVPLLDMVRYHLFGSGKTWIAEYGAADNEEDFRTLYAYSPYHHVARAAYPAVLMISADTDDRVDPMHARKMTAALQAATTSGRPVLLRIEKNAGHGGADMVKQAVELSADRYAFLMREVGLVPARRGGGADRGRGTEVGHAVQEPGPAPEVRAAAGRRQDLQPDVRRVEPRDGKREAARTSEAQGADRAGRAEARAARACRGGAPPHATLDERPRA